MRHSMVLLAVTVTVICWANSASAAIEYHFLPALNGQPSGYAQFAQIAPVVGPSNFKVTVSGAQAGNQPVNAPLTSHAYMDKWGLAVLSPSNAPDKGITGQVELNGNEFIRLEFQTAVQLTYLTFASVGSTDMVALKAGNSNVDLMASAFPGKSSIMAISDCQDPNRCDGHIDFTKAAAALPFAKTWDIYATAGDGVQLENVGVVPEPSTLALWLIGLSVVGVSAARRRRKAAP